MKLRWPILGLVAMIMLIANAGVRAFAAPTQGPQSDWLLVLDDAAKGYPIR